MHVNAWHRKISLKWPLVIFMHWVWSYIILLGLLLARVFGSVLSYPFLFSSGEALGAIGALESLGILEKFCSDACSEVAETCQLAVKRIQWIHDNTITKHPSESASPFLSVDPTPYASSEISAQELEDCLLDSSASMYDRYRAMFALRNKKDVHSVKILARGWFVFQNVF